jgi:hypothetical protein
VSAGAVCDGCDGPVRYERHHYRVEDRPPDSLLGFHNVTRYDLCSADCMATLGHRLAARDSDIEQRVAAARSTVPGPGERTLNLTEPCDGPGGPPLTARQLRRWWWRRQTATTGAR